MLEMPELRPRRYIWVIRGKEKKSWSEEQIKLLKEGVDSYTKEVTAFRKANTHFWRRLRQGLKKNRRSELECYLKMKKTLKEEFRRKYLPVVRLEMLNTSTIESYTKRKQEEEVEGKVSTSSTISSDPRRAESSRSCTDPTISMLSTSPSLYDDSEVTKQIEPTPSPNNQEVPTSQTPRPCIDPSISLAYLLRVDDEVTKQVEPTPSSNNQEVPASQSSRSWIRPSIAVASTSSASPSVDDVEVEFTSSPDDQPGPASQSYEDQSFETLKQMVDNLMTMVEEQGVQCTKGRERIYRLLSSWYPSASIT